MDNNYMPILNNERNIKHLSHLPSIALRAEINTAKLIHPNGNENLDEMLKTFDKITVSDISEAIAIDINKNPILKQSGIYGIRCGKNNDYIYIGETIRSFQERLNEHFVAIQNNCHTNKKLSQHINKSLAITIYFFEHHQSIPEYKLKFKTYCLLREYYYQEIFLINKFKLLNTEDSLHKMFTCGLFGIPYCNLYIERLFSSKEINEDMSIQDTCKLVTNKVTNQDLAQGWIKFKSKFYN